MTVDKFEFRPQVQPLGLVPALLVALERLGNPRPATVLPANVPISARGGPVRNTPGGHAAASQR